MAEVVVQFSVFLPGPDGRSFAPRACGRPMEEGGLWEGWIEFVPDDGSETLRTRRETEQPNWQDLQYWASGLTTTYLEGALTRALEPVRPGSGVVEVSPAYEGPAPEPTPAAGVPPQVHPRAVLDPVDVYRRQGEDVLRQDLTALEAAHLRNILRAHALVDESAVDLQALGRTALAELILAATRKRVQDSA
jgi:hypothetical protein